MKLWKLGWILVVTSVVLAGCATGDIDDDTGTDAGTGADAGTLKCTSDAECGSGRTCDTTTGQCKDKVVERSLSCADNSGCLVSELCHPTAKVCVQTCTGSFDCPDSAKTCEAVSATYTQKVCKCSTNELCNIERDTADLVCTSVDRVCAPRCTSDVACGTGKSCDTATGQCKVKETDTTGSPCVGEGQSTCNYGTYCQAGVCSALPAPVCDNYQNFTNRNALGTTGPILFGARVRSATTDTGYCPEPTPTHVKLVLSAYSSVPFPPYQDGLRNLFRVLVSGSAVDATRLVTSTSSDYVVSGTNRERADITVNLCASSASVTLSTAFYFTSGNFLCFQAHW